MTVTELIIELAALPGDLEVVFDATKPEDGEFFRLECVTSLDRITTDRGEDMIIINCPESHEKEDFDNLN